MKIQTRFFTLITLVGLYVFGMCAQPVLADEGKQDKLCILFSCADKEVMTKMAAPYAMFAMQKEWWQEVTFLIWGPSAKMIAEDEELLGQLHQLTDAGVTLQACKWCAEQYGVAEKLAAAGVEVKYMGEPLTEMLKSDYKVLTF